MANIWPVWDLYTKTREGNIAPVMMGSGLGTASVVNNNLGGGGELWNPNSQVIRLLYEVGIVGTAFLVVAFVYPVKVVTSREAPPVRRRFLIFTCLLVGLFLAHRSTASFIYLGIFLATLGGTAAPLESSKRSSARRIAG